MKKINKNKINKENKEEKARKVKKSAPKMPNSAKFTEQEIQYYFQQSETPYFGEENEEI